ncbi:MAG TPA: phage tail protein [Flavobacteriales bacterium]|jgi:phage tail-like protein|nr:phage tail protein [Flavobacteriales bacterium]
MNEIIPPASFFFALSFSGEVGKVDALFNEVSGISMETGVEEIAEGGNPFVHRVPTTVKYSNLVLKRGLVAKNSEVAKWCLKSLGGFSSTTSTTTETLTTKTIIVHLLDEDGKPLQSWSFFNALPVKWSISGSNAMINEISIETLELSYSYFQVL